MTQYWKDSRLQRQRQIIEEEGTARQHGDTLEKRGISVDDVLNPSRENHSKKIKHFDRINKSIKEKLLAFAPENEELTTFSDQGYQLPGGEWDTLLAKWIKENRGCGPTLSDRMSNLRIRRSQEDEIQERLARGLISVIEKQHELCFHESKFPLFGFMREVATNEKKHPKWYLWQGEADAIAGSWKLNKYVIVEFKVVDNLSDYLKRKTDLCGKHLHQCLVYAKLLQLHMKLDYLPPCLIVVIHKFTGNEGYFALFKDYPQECKDKLDEYEWFTEQPSKRPLEIADRDKLLNNQYQHRGPGVVFPHTRLLDIFAPNATVKDLLDFLGYDSLEVFRQPEEQ